MDADQQRRLVGDQVPALDLKPKVMVAEEIPNGILKVAHELSVWLPVGSDCSNSSPRSAADSRGRVNRVVVRAPEVCGILGAISVSYTL